MTIGRPGRPSFIRALPLAGWSGRSRWGYDAVYECYWAELWSTGAAAAGRGAAPGPVLQIGPERLLVSIPTLARVLASSAEIPPEEAYLALTA